MSAVAQAWSVDWATGWDAVPEAGAWWRAESPSDRGAHVYDRWGVMLSWLETVGRASGLQPAFASAIGPGGRTVRLAAVVGRQQGRLVSRRVLEPLGQDLFGYQQPMTAADAAGIEWDGFWDAVAQSSSALCDQALWRGVPAARAAATRSVPGDGSPVLSLAGAGSLDELLDRCSPNHRGDVRRRLRRMREQGDVSVWVAGPGDAEQARREFQQATWPAWLAHARRREWTLADRPGFEAYCLRLIESGVPQGVTHFSVLRVGGESLAWHLGLQDERRLYWWLPVHDEAREALSPGKVLLSLLVSHLIAEGWRELHFLTGAQAYKLAWKPAMADVRSLRWHGSSWRGAALRLYDQRIGGVR